MRKVSPGLLANLDRSHAWRASLPIRCGKIDEMSLIPNSPNPFVRGLASYSGRRDHVNFARHEELTRCSAPCGQGYSVARYGNGLRGRGKICRTEKRRKKTPAMHEAQRASFGRLNLRAMKPEQASPLNRQCQLSLALSRGR